MIFSFQRMLIFVLAALSFFYHTVTRFDLYFGASTSTHTSI